MNERAASPVQSVDRALEILEHLAAHGESGVTALADHLGVHRSTAFRLLGALEARRLVEQPGERGRYRLGVGIVRLAGAVTAQMDLTRVSRPLCERLADAVAETVNVAVWDDGHVVNVDQVRGGRTLLSHNWIGERTAAHATSSGKVLLAYAPNRLPLGRLRRFTPRTITSRRDLEAELVRVRVEGVARTREELEIGLNAVAAPVRAADGSVVAAISVAGWASRLDEARMDEVAPSVRACADEVSVRLGWTGVVAAR